MSKLLAGSFVLAVGFLLVATNLTFGLGGGSFVDSFPVDSEWSNSGTHDNTFTNAEEQLIIDDLSDDTATGVFTSDVFSNGNGIEINNIIYEADNIKKTGDTRTIEIEIYGLDENGAIIDTKVLDLDNGRYSVSVGEFENQIYDNYQFVVNMESEGSSSPQLSELQISGINYEDGDSHLLADGIGYLFIFIGLLMAVGAIYD